MRREAGPHDGRLEQGRDGCATKELASVERTEVTWTYHFGLFPEVDGIRRMYRGSRPPSGSNLLSSSFAGGRNREVWFQQLASLLDQTPKGMRNKYRVSGCPGEPGEKLSIDGRPAPGEGNMVASTAGHERLQHGESLAVRDSLRQGSRFEAAFCNRGVISRERTARAGSDS
jgi:hypothetical protein